MFPKPSKGYPQTDHDNMKTHLTFDQAVQALLQSSYTTCRNPIKGEDTVIISARWDEEGDDAIDFILEPEGGDPIYMSPKDKFKITEDGRGFSVLGHSWLIFPHQPFNFKE